MVAGYFGTGNVARQGGKRRTTRTPVCRGVRTLFTMPFLVNQTDDEAAAMSGFRHVPIRIDTQLHLSLAYSLESRISRLWENSVHEKKYE